MGKAHNTFPSPARGRVDSTRRQRILDLDDVSMWKHAQPTPQLWSRMSLTLANCEHLGLLKLSGGQLRLKKVQPLLQQKHAETITRDRLFAIKHKSLKQSCVGLTSHSTAWPGLLEQEFIVPDCSMGVEAVDGNRPFHSCQVK